MSVRPVPAYDIRRTASIDDVVPRIGERPQGRRGNKRGDGHARIPLRPRLRDVDAGDGVETADKRGAQFNGRGDGPQRLSGAASAGRRVIVA
jgi:hypothetical protein